MERVRRLSTNSSIVSDDINNSVTKLISKVKQSKQIFVGTYLERRYVKSVPAYRDIVVIDKEEVDTVKHLTEIQHVVRTEFGDEKWLGITCNMVDDEVTNYNLWVELEQVPLGKHWFQIRSLKMHENTIQLQIKHLRPYEGPESESFIDTTELPPFNLKEILTYHNLCEVAKFSAILIMSIITVTGNILWYMSEYTLRLTRELSHLITALTPIIFGLYEFLSKCVGGFYWLVYLLFRGNSTPKPFAPPPMMMTTPRRPIEYRQQYPKYRRF